MPTVSAEPPSSEASLVAQLTREMADRWQRQDQPCAEEFLNRHPELWTHPRAALRLIYEEICLRQERGQADASQQLRERFPQWRSELAMLRDCHDLLGPEGTRLPLLAAGQSVGDFQLLAELGHGGQGCVFLASQAALAHRPVVLKFTPCTGREHVTLARLQHTYIVPLYAAQEDPEHNLRILCMPYLGGASLARLLQLMQGRPAAERAGRDLLEAVDHCQAALPIAVPARGQVRSWLASASYEHAICWLGVCLAEALQYAHERGLVHLDLSPANILVTADGQPMLLDFHLAREPLQPGAPGPNWLGGTPGYMPPEQARALAALRNGAAVPCVVDQRADLFALGMVLFEALGGSRPSEGAAAAASLLRQHNPRVSVGLADVLARCLAAAPQDRYAAAADLADDLKRHLAGQPLRGVANRSVRERWHKWRRRHPYALTVLGALLAIGTAGWITWNQGQRQAAEAQAALQTGQSLLVRGQYAEAAEQLARGRALATALTGQGDLTRTFDALLARAQQGFAAEQGEQTVHKLHQAVEALRFQAVADGSTPAQLQSLEATCRGLWATRHRLAGTARLDSAQEARRPTDLQDVAIIWSDVRARQARDRHGAALHREMLQILAEAAELYGNSSALHWERRRHEQALGIAQTLPATALQPRTAWEHLLLGRSLFWAGELARARAELNEAVARDPGNFWSHYYQGVAAYRQGDARDAVQAFSVCIALAPHTAACYYNRALAHTHLKALADAERDYRRALQLDPTLTAAAFNRELLRTDHSLQEKAIRRQP